MARTFQCKNARRSGKGVERLLGDLELAIMRAAWSRESVTVRDVLEALARKRPLAYTTVMTVMGRLADKRLLLAEKRGKSYLYRATRTREEFEAQTAGEMVYSLISDFGEEIAISQFVKQLSETDPGQLVRLADLARRAQDSHDEG